MGGDRSVKGGEFVAMLLNGLLGASADRGGAGGKLRAFAALAGGEGGVAIGEQLLRTEAQLGRLLWADAVNRDEVHSQRGGNIADAGLTQQADRAGADAGLLRQPFERDGSACDFHGKPAFVLNRLLRTGGGG